jgi:lipopolysaccharide transport system ATP-binding protein
MQLRLAFAVAAHLEPEILIIDEVLAVGDAEFQKKSLNKMEAVANSGRTVLFVSHNLNAVENLCKKALLLNNGILELPPTNSSKVIEQYLSVNNNEHHSIWFNERNEYSNKIFELNEISLVDRRDKPIVYICKNNDDFWFRVSFAMKQDDPLFYFGYALFNETGQLFYWSQSKDADEVSWPKLNVGNNVLYSKIPQWFLNEGNYRIELIASIHFKKWLIAPSTGPFLNFQIQGGLSDSPYFVAKRKGFLAPVFNWTKTML